MYHRPLPAVRPSASAPTSTYSTPRMTPLLPSAAMAFTPSAVPVEIIEQPILSEANSTPRICGMQLKYVSLVLLAVQNAALSIVMHYSRVSTPANLAYSPASAVLLNELLKGSISFLMALFRLPEMQEISWRKESVWGIVCALPWPWTTPFWHLCADIFSPDAWKLSIPAILYVIQNSLQFVAISNLPVASFQVTYQMKILTTAAFSVALLRKKMNSRKWLALLFLAIGVGIVQIQTSTVSQIMSPHRNTPVGSAYESAPLHVHIMNPFKGFCSVIAACFTSGLAGVYFEMVLKGSKADLWVRNCQLSLFSLIPALLPILYARSPPNSQGFVYDIFRHFGGWAWATVSIQVFGGLVTAIVIKYSDNILKGFATSLSIILSFLASVVLFDFKITPTFIIGASTVLSATWMYNKPSTEPSMPLPSKGSSLLRVPSEPILGEFGRKRSPAGPSLRSSMEKRSFETLHTPRYLQAPYGSPYNSRSPSPRPPNL